MNKYKTLKELKEELGDKYEDFLYKAGINLLDKIDIYKDWLKEEMIKNKTNKEYVKMLKKCLNKIEELVGDNYE